MATSQFNTGKMLPYEIAFAMLCSWNFVKFEVSTVVTMKNAVFWDVTPRGARKSRRFGGSYHLHKKVTRIGELGKTLAVTSNRRTLRIYG
jgi:hypothetical protein